MSPVLEARKKDSAPLRRASLAAAALGVLAFWCGLLMAARFYPSPYDWRYMSVSHLLSPDRNPAGYLWASAGIGLCALCGFWWVAVADRLADLARERMRGLGALQFGYFCMLCAALLTKWLLRIRKGHEVLVTLAFAGLLIGMVPLMFQIVERTLLRRMRGPGVHTRLYVFIAAGIAVCPIVLAGIAQAYFYYVPPEFHWISFSWKVRGWPVLLLFPFWEWVMCVVLSAYMVIIPLAMHAVYPARKATEEEGRERSRL